MISNNGWESGLGECEGDCDQDDDCASGLKCFQRSGLTPVPGCLGSGVRDIDYCYNPLGSTPLSGDDDMLAQDLGACTGVCHIETPEQCT